MNNVLKDMRVLDFGRFITCLYYDLLLADMGAEVIRGERTGGEGSCIDRFVNQSDGGCNEWC